MRASTIIFTAIALLLSASAVAGDNLPTISHPPAVQMVPAVNGLAIVPTEPGASVHRFGSGVIVDRTGQASQMVSPFGSGVIVSEPGKPSVVCSRFGGGTTCR